MSVGHWHDQVFVCLWRSALSNYLVHNEYDIVCAVGLNVTVLHRMRETLGTSLWMNFVEFIRFDFVTL